MANKKKKKANRPKPVAGPSTEKLAKDRAEFEASVEAAQEEKSKPAPKKEAKPSGKGKDKDKVVVKSKARATNPNKSNKKPNIFRRFLDYIKQVRLEIKRTTWPTNNEVLNMTIIVLVALLFFGTFIFLIDFVMVRFVEFYGHLIPEAEVDIPSLVDDIAEGLGDELEDGAPAVKLLRGLDFLKSWSFFGGE